MDCAVGFDGFYFYCDRLVGIEECFLREYDGLRTFPRTHIANRTWMIGLSIAGTMKDADPPDIQFVHRHSDSNLPI